MLKDILDGITDREKGRAVIGSAGRNEPVIYQVPHGFNNGGIKYDKSPALTANGSWQSNNFISEPVGVAQRGRYAESGSRSFKCDGGTEQYYEARTDGKSNCISTVQKDSMVAEPIPFNTFNDDGEKSRTLMAGYYKYGEATLITNKGFKGGTTAIAQPIPVNVTANEKSQTLKAQYSKSGVMNFCAYSSTYGASGIAEPVHIGALPRPNGELSTSQSMRIYSDNGKSANITSGGGGAGGKTGLYAIPINTTNGEKSQCLRATYYKDGIRNLIGNDVDKRTAVAIPIEFDNGVPIKAISGADGKTYTVYEVKDGLISIKDKQYPIKLADGYYIIRKLTVSECKRLQTIPEWYEFPVSDTQAYKMLGNGWTVDVIVHLLQAIIESESSELKTEFYVDTEGQLAFV